MTGIVLLSGPYMEHLIGALVILIVIVFVIGAAIRHAIRRADRWAAREMDAAEQRRGQGRL